MCAELLGWSGTVVRVPPTQGGRKSFRGSIPLEVHGYILAIGGGRKFWTFPRKFLWSRVPRGVRPREKVSRDALRTTYGDMYVDACAREVSWLAERSRTYHVHRYVRWMRTRKAIGGTYLGR